VKRRSFKGYQQLHFFTEKNYFPFGRKQASLNKALRAAPRISAVRCACFES